MIYRRFIFFNEDEGINSSNSSETAESDIQSSCDLEANDDDVESVIDWCDITVSGQVGSPLFPFTGTPGVTFPVNSRYI